MVNKVVHSTGSDEWATPRSLFTWLRLNRNWVPQLDVACNVVNRVCDSFLLGNALEQSWSMREKENVWCNPPYSKSKEFVEKAHEEFLTNPELDIYMLLPVRTGRSYWQELLDVTYSVEFIQGRLYFGGSKASAPFDSCLVRFKKELENVCLRAPVIEQVIIPLEFRR